MYENRKVQEGRKIFRSAGRSEILKKLGLKFLCCCRAIVAEQKENIENCCITLEGCLGGGGRFFDLMSWSISF